MKKLLIVVDMQNDFVSGIFGSQEAKQIVPIVADKVNQYKARQDIVVFTRDTHGDEYSASQEGKHLPLHCKEGTDAHAIIKELDTTGCLIDNKHSFASLAFVNKVVDIVKQNNIQEIELCGLCTDICVVSNALAIKSAIPNTPLVVQSTACAGVTIPKHQAALEVMASCQVRII